MNNNNFIPSTKTQLKKDREDHDKIRFLKKFFLFFII